MKSEKKSEIKCALCGKDSRVCEEPGGKGPGFCPTLEEEETLGRALNEYSKDEIRRFARNASIQEGEAYAFRGSGEPTQAVKPRVQEVIEFAHKMGYKKIGLAFCAGLRREAAMAERIFTSQDLQVVSVVCKAGGTPKETLGITDDQKIAPGEHESMCNPIGQAMLLNEKKTEFNIVFGLCVGHDSLFLQHSKAPCTVLVVKDRVTGHNPLAAIYTSGSYYKRMGETKFEKGGAVDIVSRE